MNKPITRVRKPTNIAADLLRQLGLEQAATWEDLIATAKPVKTAEKSPVFPAAKFFVAAEAPEAKVKFRVAEQLDVICDALICDSLLGTIGLLHLLPKSASRKEIRQRLDEAAFLRHLLLEHLQPGSPHDRCSPFTVEVIIALQPSCEGLLKDLVETLRELMRESSYLRAIGVNLLQLPESGGPGESELRRAFAWLLRDTRKWFAGLQPRNGAAYRRLRQMELSCFRLDGTRVWNVEDGEFSASPNGDMLHLIHGHNGTGKSTLAEAVELLVTGRLARVSSDQDLAKVVTNSAARARLPRCRAVLHARFGASGRGPRNVKGHVQREGFSSPLDKRPAEHRISSNAFRLNQELVDQLAKALPAERARVLLEAFFPEERPLAEKAKQIDIRARDELAKLGGRLREKLTTSIGDPCPAGIKAETEWITKAGKGGIAWTEVLKLMPAKASDLLPLATALNQSLAKRLSAKDQLAWGALLERAKELDGSLHWLSSRLPQLTELAPLVDKLLESFEAGVSGGQRLKGGELRTQLNQWLRLVALTDLREHEDRVLTTLERARKLDRNLRLDTVTAPLLAQWKTLTAATTGAGNADFRRKALDELIRRRDRLRTGLTSEDTATATRRSRAKRPEWISNEDSDRLDQAARLGLFGEAWKEAQPSFGEALRQAVDCGKPVLVKAGARSVEVGAPGWCAELRQLMARLSQSAQSVSAVSSEFADPRNQLASTLEALATLSKLAVELDGTNHKLTERLGNQFAPDQPLGKAFNELLVVFTPARWAYQDIRSRASFSGANQSVELETDNIATRLRLNTAELNAMALALFLLCAPANPNPLRMAVLDDPLQNMDEVTVTTVARGLGRIARLWRTPGLRLQDWRIAMFLHAEENVERVRDETPCVVHHLPWIAPSSLPPPDEPIEIPRYAPRRGFEFQPLAELLNYRPPDWVNLNRNPGTRQSKKLSK